MREPYWRTLLGRLIISLLLVFWTYNESHYSYYHWVVTQPFEGHDDPMGVFKLLIGLILFLAYIALAWATFRAKGPFGITLMLIVLGSVVYYLTVINAINLNDSTTAVAVTQVIAALALAIGSTWSIFWRRITGQVAVEDPDTA